MGHEYASVLRDRKWRREFLVLVTIHQSYRGSQGQGVSKEWWEVQLPEVWEDFEKLDSVLASEFTVMSLRCSEANDGLYPKEN